MQSIKGSSMFAQENQTNKMLSKDIRMRRLPMAHENQALLGNQSLLLNLSSSNNIIQRKLKVEGSDITEENHSILMQDNGIEPTFSDTVLQLVNTDFDIEFGSWDNLKNFMIRSEILITNMKDKKFAYNATKSNRFRTTGGVSTKNLFKGFEYNCWTFIIKSALAGRLIDEELAATLAKGQVVPLSEEDGEAIRRARENAISSAKLRLLDMDQKLSSGDITQEDYDTTKEFLDENGDEAAKSEREKVTTYSVLNLLSNAKLYNCDEKNNDEIITFLQTIPKGFIISFQKDDDDSRATHVFLSLGDGGSSEFDKLPTSKSLRCASETKTNIADIWRRYNAHGTVKAIWYCAPEWNKDGVTF